MNDLTKIYIRADRIDNLLQVISEIVYKHKDTENDAQCDEIMSEIDNYCEENGLNLDNPEYEEFYFTRLDKMKVVNNLLEQVVAELKDMQHE